MKQKLKHMYTWHLVMLTYTRYISSLYTMQLFPNCNIPSMCLCTERNTSDQGWPEYNGEAYQKSREVWRSWQAATLSFYSMHFSSSLHSLFHHLCLPFSLFFCILLFHTWKDMSLFSQHNVLTKKTICYACLTDNTFPTEAGTKLLFPGTAAQGQNLWKYETPGVSVSVGQLF